METKSKTSIVPNRKSYLVNGLCLLQVYPRRLAPPQTLRPGQVHEMQLTAAHLRKREAEFSGNAREVIVRECEACVCRDQTSTQPTTFHNHRQDVGVKGGVRVVSLFLSLSLVSSLVNVPFVSPAHDPSRIRRASSGTDYCVRSYLCTRSCGSHTFTRKQEGRKGTKRMGRKGYMPLETRCLCDVFALQ